MLALYYKLALMTKLTDMPHITIHGMVKILTLLS